MQTRHSQPSSDGRACLEQASVAAKKLLAYCQGDNWAGYDPYDALNSRLFKALPLLDFKLFRLVFTQSLKRSPVNIRQLVLIPKTQNAKAIGLFLSASLNLRKAGMAGEDLPGQMVERLVALRSQGIPYWCWGYSFPWQMRSKIVPAGAPNLVCTTFAADALMNAYEQRHDPQCLTMAASAAEYILNELHWSEGGLEGFAYPLPTLRGQVYNANFLAAALFCRVYKHTGETRFLEPALRVTRYCAAQQRADGSWLYGDGPTQGWVDNFHTGFNLGALRSISQSLGTSEFESNIRLGFEFYINHFFRRDGAPRYFHDRTYPIDIHCVAQSILTLMEFQNLDSRALPLAQSVFGWAMDHMWDDRGFFYYRVLRSVTIRTPYMRWAQAWMLLALSALVCELQAGCGDRQSQNSAAFVEAR